MRHQLASLGLALPETEEDTTPPPPMTRREARAAGLYAYPSFYLCQKDGTNLRTMARNQCVACQARKAEERRARDKAIADRARAKALKEARAVILRELAREKKAAEEKERRQQKAAETRARNKAAKVAAAEEPATVAARRSDAAPCPDGTYPSDDGSATVGLRPAWNSSASSSCTTRSPKRIEAPASP
ncbi:hypothetical protein [Rubrivivax gelatinosus]|uniref:hypothetical protein n=1 Tax=Rubrivivax gelatinosus TaxID=28068 RepID=UPI0012FD9590|nr:hypothetical protein [Rubrivivax gelatinosus]MBG6078703.1 membrane protein involved in colicin uptake [Rubrivivax gelatinosus]